MGGLTLTTIEHRTNAAAALRAGPGGFWRVSEWHDVRRFRHWRLEKVNIEALLIAEVGAGGGLAFTGSSESLQISSDWAFSYRSKGVFQHAVVVGTRGST